MGAFPSVFPELDNCLQVIASTQSMVFHLGQVPNLWYQAACGGNLASVGVQSWAMVSLIGTHYCGETSAWPGTCANFNPTNLAPPKHHARLRCQSRCESTVSTAVSGNNTFRALGGMFCNARATHTAKLCPKNTGAKTQKCWDKKSCAGSAGAKKVFARWNKSHLAHCFQEMSACMIADI